MRKIIILSFITLDGIMQAPGAPEEDTSGGFRYGSFSLRAAGMYAIPQISRTVF